MRNHLIMDYLFNFNILIILISNINSVSSLGRDEIKKALG